MIAKVILSILQVFAILFLMGGILTTYVILKHYNTGTYFQAWLFFLPLLMLITPALAVWVQQLLKKRV